MIILNIMDVKHLFPYHKNRNYMNGCTNFTNNSEQSDEVQSSYSAIVTIEKTTIFVL